MASSGLAGEVSERMASRTSGRRSSTTRSASGRSAIFRYVGRARNGWKVWKPMSRLSGRPPTWPRRSAPSALASWARRRTSRHWSGARLCCERAKLTGRPIVAERRRIHADLALGGGEVLAHHARGRELEQAGPELAEHRADAEQLVLGGEGAGHRLAVDGAVHDRARGREAERAGADAVAHELGHGRDVVGGGGLVAGAALAHHVARAPRRAAPACRRRRRAACVRARRGTRGRSPSPR